ncbi:MAG: Cyclic di-AMP synthase CdaA [Chlamydiia bacterium]|nr:Cyclic di-AMP synthase CdaA [Chlamydiia bacterium]
MDLILGFIAFILIFAFSSLLPFPVLHKLMLLVANVAVIAIIVIFQPELRVALSKLSFKSKRFKQIDDFDIFLEELTSSVYNLASKQTGALIVLEKEDSLEDYINKSSIIGAKFSTEIVDAIFSRYSPLHDGAIIVRDQKIAAAQAILPLADTPHVQRNLGTRHRAAVGLSITTDAVVIVASEENGKVSIAREGIITRGIKIERFKVIIRSLFTSDEDVPEEPKKSFNFGMKV